MANPIFKLLCRNKNDPTGKYLMKRKPKLGRKWDQSRESTEAKYTRKVE